MPRWPKVTFAQRFWAKVQKTDDCWLWTGTRDRLGYGRIKRDGSKGTVLAHRAAFEIALVEIPDGMAICHHCDNPRCVRPSHLFLGTRADNNRDMAAKGRASNQRKGATHCVHGHAFTPENTYHYERNGRQRRGCKACIRRNHARHLERTGAGSLAPDAFPPPTE